ncbi:cysteine desulfurase SufE subunit [Candidatus Sulcia muelleri SMDSEM]|uniref:Cysteine desulfurase SufE subunit n=1 Tax=Karelsulcia muelleri (strain SMDSEM) TaxID=595499 RepID=C7LK39_KARMS|nr:cysteine desulfurase SufE subunit [Candidatus Karelsulcia muelleri SMDSEM]WGS83200.1 MAG: SufE family protein [Candidatus Karelsulcia muelleri]
MNLILKKEKYLINKIKSFSSLEERYFFLINHGKKLLLMNKKNLIDKNLIEDCQSKLWIKINLNKKKLILKIFTTALFPKGIFFLIKYIYSNSSLKEIKNYNHNFYKQLNFKSFFSQLRNNGLLFIINKILFFNSKFLK